jgi:alanyl-tRNA synthetase
MLLYGLGTGLVIGSILVQLMNQAAQVAPKATDSLANPSIEQMDAMQVKEAAYKYYQVYPKEEKLYNQAQVDALVQQKIAEEKTKLEQTFQTSAKKTYIYISSGLSSSQVAEMLYQSGLIIDRKAFEDAMRQQQLNYKIQAGVHVFEGQPDMDQIISNITSR